MEILFKKEVCKYLDIPSIPLKEWNGKDSFKAGVGVTRLALGEYAYAVCTFDANNDAEPRIKKTFANEPFYDIEHIFVVPSFMDTDVDDMDLDDQSKEAAKRIVEETQEMKSSEDDIEREMKKMDELPEWVFDEIHNKEEAMAWLRRYNSVNKIKGRIPENEETLKLRLLNIHSQQKEK